MEKQILSFSRISGHSMSYLFVVFTWSIVLTTRNSIHYQLADVVYFGFLIITCWDNMELLSFLVTLLTWEVYVRAWEVLFFLSVPRISVDCSLPNYQVYFTDLSWQDR
ncbi:hypothetical protein KFK09_021809 [Dendrobium nobile]|uniref:Uncharacterized protein n=1 Tax=Dendrobium nobile TaxID=94219 RepID=A0A8T3AH74_DENNO|nr:hypothetical protein KFK09_021809 [Dendrobium nobile]